MLSIDLSTEHSGSLRAALTQLPASGFKLCKLSPVPRGHFKTVLRKVETLLRLETTVCCFAGASISSHPQNGKSYKKGPLALTDFEMLPYK